MSNGYKVITERFTVTNPMGLDLRCVRMLTQTVLQFQVEIEVKCPGGAADGKSLLEVLALDVNCGTEVEVSIYGSEALQAHQAIQYLFYHAFASEALPKIHGSAVA